MFEEVDKKKKKECTSILIERVLFPFLQYWLTAKWNLTFTFMVIPQCIPHLAVVMSAVLRNDLTVFF